MMVPLSGPDITEREKQLVLEVLDSGQLSLGTKLEEFEERMAAYTGKRYAIACNSGTSGLHMLVRALGIGEGDEVITTPFSFVASSNCILFERAKPVFVDIDEETFNMRAELIERRITEKTKAILPVHVFGQPSNMEAIMDVAKRYGLAVIEDACEAIGAKWNGRMAGTFGDAGVFAFYPNKQMTTGEGGMIVTDDAELAAICRSLRNQGRGEEQQWLSHVRLGWNYRMDEMSAALGIAQMERIAELLSRRKAIAERYLAKLSRVPGLLLPTVDPRAEVSWFVFVIRLADSIRRHTVMKNLQAKGIGCRPYFPPIHLQPFYRQQFGFQPGDFPVTERVAASTLAIPFFSGLTEAQIDYVCQIISQEMAVCR